MKHCIHCGVALEDNARFCESCGQPQEAVDTQPAAASNTAQPTKQGGSALPWIAIIVISVTLLIGVVVFAGIFLGGWGEKAGDNPPTEPSISVPVTTITTEAPTTPTTAETTIPATPGNQVVHAVKGQGVTYHVSTPSGVNLRTGPGTGYSTICGIPNNLDVIVYAQQDGWSYVEFSNESGWIKSEYLAYGPAPSGRVTWFSSSYTVTCIEGDGINVRTGPGTGYARVCGIPYGYSARVYGRSGDWLYVYYPTAGKEGWIHSAYVR